MSRAMPAAAWLLLVALYFPGSSHVWCYEGSYPLFHAQPSAPKHAGSGPGVGHNGGGVVTSPVSHGSLAPEHHSLPQQPQQQKHPSVGLFQSIVPLAQHPGVLRRRAAEPGGTVNHHRWHADQRPPVFGRDVVPAVRALPALDIGRPGSDEDYADHRPGGPRPMDTFDLPAGLDTAENEIGDGAMSAVGQAGSGRMTESIDLIREQLERIKAEEDIEIKSNLLMKLLAELPEGPLPIVYIEDVAGATATGDTGDDEDDQDAPESDDEDEGRIVTEQFTPNAAKRSGRYYRRYPWKRQNSRSRTYDAEARYLCVPSRDDVFKLLVGLHENRVGNHQRTVNFCNRKRPAKAIFTNIRFLG